MGEFAIRITISLARGLLWESCRQYNIKLGQDEGQESKESKKLDSNEAAMDFKFLFYIYSWN